MTGHLKLVCTCMHTFALCALRNLPGISPLPCPFSSQQPLQFNLSPVLTRSPPEMMVTQCPEQCSKIAHPQTHTATKCSLGDCVLLSITESCSETKSFCLMWLSTVASDNLKTCGISFLQGWPELAGKEVGEGGGGPLALEITLALVPETAESE